LLFDQRKDGEEAWPFFLLWTWMFEDVILRAVAAILGP